jgi:archaellum biogenesis protein FlaJ (TadC family)
MNTVSCKMVWAMERLLASTVAVGIVLSLVGGFFGIFNSLYHLLFRPSMTVAEILTPSLPAKLTLIGIVLVIVGISTGVVAHMITSFVKRSQRVE